VTLARNLVTNAEWLAFMKDGGYATPTLWLMDGLRPQATSNGRHRPLAEISGEWHVMTLAGLQPVDPAAPVCHVSYYEADAFARWSGKHLPTEMEWEVAARAGHLNDAFGIVWQWTRSAYRPIPATAPSRARSANITASSWSTSWCCAAHRLQPRKGTAVSPIVTSSIPSSLAIHGTAPRRLPA
jgi:formylglycine-generating enzyme required for sulfatase activity